jgi:3,2-trans-enoyl-CoA isomerase
MLLTIDHGPVRELQLARPPVNALDPGLVQALRLAVAHAPDDGARALVISGRAGLFSAGLDVPALQALDRAAMRTFWRDFFDLLRTLAASPLPLCAAMAGHSPAGGMVIGLFCDRRIAAAGEYKLGLNEVQVGLPVPPVILAAHRLLIGPRESARLAVPGTMVGPDEALRIGLVDEVVAVEEVTPRARAWCEQLLGLPPLAMSATRRMARAELVALFDDLAAPDYEYMSEWWSGEECQAAMRAMLERVRSK